LDVPHPALSKGEGSKRANLKSFYLERALGYFFEVSPFGGDLEGVLHQLRIILTFQEDFF